MKYLKYKEQRRHGTFNFPIEFYHVTQSHPRYQMPYHWHMEFELIRILDGTFLININEKKFTAGVGDIIFIQSGELHGGTPDHCVYECIVYDFSALFMHTSLCQSKIQDIWNGSIHINEFFPSRNDLIHQIAYDIFEAVHSRAIGYELTVYGGFYKLFGRILENHYYTDNVSLKSNKHILRLKQVLELIESSYSMPLTLNDLAAAAGMNAKSFCSYFRDMTQRTPIDYLNYYRIEQACFDLTTTDKTITQVALDCGFNDISHFIRTFKKYKGLTPKKYLDAPL